jgi:hypothetical protein
VTFVRDYVQLQFNPPPCLNAYNAVSVLSGGKKVRQGQEAFANALIAQISKVVYGVEMIPSEALVIRFQDGSEISVSLHPADYRGPEGALLLGRDNRWDVLRIDDVSA